MLFLLLFITINIFSTEITPIIIQDTSIQDEETVKNIKNHNNKLTTEAIEDNSEVFLRKSGGIGSNILFYIDSSTSSQVSISIENFDYTTPSLAMFSPTSMYFGVFDNISINKDDSFSQNSINTHSANINFSINNKNYISSLFGSFGTFGINSNSHIKIFDSSLDIGGVILNSKNNFEYISFNKKKRIRNNSFYEGGDFYIKYNSEKIKFLNYFIINKKGTPGSAQFERLEASTSNLQNLLGISYSKNMDNFDLELKFSENYKNYFYIDKKPPIFGLKEINYNLKSNTITSDVKLGFKVYDFSYMNIKLGNLSYFAKSESFIKDKNIPNISEFHSFFGIKEEFYFFDDELIFNVIGRYYLENLYQYSLSGLYYINKYLMIKLLTKKGLRIPYLEEKYWKSSSVIGNPKLLPETTYKNLISIKFEYSVINLTLEFFYSKLINNIIFTPISFALIKSINTREAIAKGFNFDLKLISRYINLIEIFSYNNTIYKETKKDLPQTPNLQNKLTFSIKYKAYSFNITHIYTDKYYNNIFNTDIIPKKYLISLNLKYTFSENGSNINIKINNLTNELKYYDSLHIPLPGRSYFTYLNFYF